jgi:predicted branched-subunit amino acid permease
MCSGVGPLPSPLVSETAFPTGSADSGDRAGPARGGRDRSDREIIARAVRDTVPVLIPVAPFGFVLGVAILESAMPAAVGWSTSPTIFGGAAQLAVVTLAGVTTVWTVVIAALVINARHVIYSAALGPAFSAQPRWFRWLGPFVLIDQLFAVVATRTHLNPEEFRTYYLSVGAFLYVAWAMFVTVGMIIGPAVPSSWRLDSAPAVMFVGLVVVSLTRRPAVVAAVVAALVALLSAGLRDRLGILVGAVAGMIAGAIAETLAARSSTGVHDEASS